MKSGHLLKTLVIAIAFAGAACSNNGTNGGGSGGNAGAGGASAGTKGTGGGPGSGGATSTGGSSSGTGGATSKGGSTGSGGAGGGSSCANVASCGGDLSGAWTAKQTCLKASGTLDLSSFGIGCTSATVLDGTLQVAGALTIGTDGKLTDATSTTGNVKFSFERKCLEVSGTTTTCTAMAGTLSSLGFESVDCTSAADGGCACDGTVNQKGGVGLISADPQASGKVKNAGTTLTYPDDSKYSYCVSGNTLTLTPQATNPALTGTIVLQKSGSVGSGGQSGAGGGSAGSGGSSGGQTGQGGTGAGGATNAGGSSGSGGSTVASTGPCDIYQAASPATPCVGAYSMARRLYSKYSGPLYQVRKGGTWDKTAGPSGGTLKDIGMIDGGYADVSTQDAFCDGATCTVSVLYDQSGKGNDLKAAPAGCYKGGDGAAAEPDKESSATKRPTTINGHKAYALQTVSHDGYRNNKATGTVTGTGAQGIYMIADGRKAGTQCCWDFGNAMPTNCADGTGSMDALMLGSGFFGKGAGNPPWFMGDFEFGVWTCGSQSDSTKCTNPDLPSESTTEFAFGILKTSMSGSAGQYCIRTGNAQSGGVTTAYDGQAPQPWHLGGAIILGIGGDNSNWSSGTFFEGAITAGRPSDATDALVLANVQAAKYGQ